MEIINKIKLYIKQKQQNKKTSRQKKQTRSIYDRERIS